AGKYSRPRSKTGVGTIFGRDNFALANRRRPENCPDPLLLHYPRSPALHDGVRRIFRPTSFRRTRPVAGKCSRPRSKTGVGTIFGRDNLALPNRRRPENCPDPLLLHCPRSPALHDGVGRIFRPTLLRRICPVAGKYSRPRVVTYFHRLTFILITI